MDYAWQLQFSKAILDSISRIQNDALPMSSAIRSFTEALRESYTYSRSLIHHGHDNRDRMMMDGPPECAVQNAMHALSHNHILKVYN
jgi:hypothetical protein